MVSPNVDRYTSAKSIIRPKCLQCLADTISLDEKSAEYLFKAFDVSNGDLHSTSPVAISPLLPPLEPFAEPPSFSLPPRDDESDVKHPYLSTPLRMKHFSKLSPTILRGLLRSPSLRVFTPDPSVSEEHSGYLLDPALITSSRSFEHLDSNHPPTDAAEGHNLPYLISPPPAAKIPSVPHLPVCDEIYTAKMSQTVGPVLFHSKKFVSPLPSPPFEERRPSLRTHTCPASSLSASTIAQFRLVVDELGRTGNGLEKRKPLQSNLRPSLLPEASRTVDLQSQGSTGVVGNVTPLTMRAHGVLEAEFVDLLLQRAEREEAEAEQLRTSAMRLRMLAQRRRKLARIVQK
ncbi:uncharacterized protein BT62DRAFT_1073523 [Guyanagaster necrorhizus]|uniref:Uncharacterized protein n=1 Tax=Guyanagaster necrorhizus TaxID=856835 RepID=A0A9P7VWT6_9AGAR|nr:uncharacterized protein BT62DRAFT_1073523 [Guyanagaster necrorhizus MCA 3950]KAG7448981.1 hypothetical protein BT62DRAFT_1073523 [Guyanagaster necrorhizus MCA 3950]